MREERFRALEVEVEGIGVGVATVLVKGQDTMTVFVVCDHLLLRKIDHVIFYHCSP